MATAEIDKAAWQQYLDGISRLVLARPADVEVASLAAGVQQQASWLPLVGVLYDRHNDLIAFTFDGLDHMIRQPRALYVEQEGLRLRSLEVVSADGARHILRLREPLLLE